MRLIREAVLKQWREVSGNAKWDFIKWGVGAVTGGGTATALRSATTWDWQTIGVIAVAVGVVAALLLIRLFAPRLVVVFTDKILWGPLKVRVINHPRKECRIQDVRGFFITSLGEQRQVKRITWNGNYQVLPHVMPPESRIDLFFDLHFGDVIHDLTNAHHRGEKAPKSYALVEVELETGKIAAKLKKQITAEPGQTQ